MKRIEGKVFSHLSSDRTEGEWVPVTAVRKADGYPVRSYRELAKLVAALGYRNRRFNLLFRGQSKDHRSNLGGSLLYPSIHRLESGQRLSSLLAERFASLTAATKKLFDARRELGESGPGLYRHWEYQTALLQHYDIRKTPLLDASSSLRVACSFALSSSPSGYLFVLGMPHPHGSVSHFVDDDIVLVKLQNVCPPEALRPHYQEGFLLGRMTNSDKQKTTADNAAFRMLAKYKLVNENGSFWDQAFAPIPTNTLLPENDKFYERLLSIVGG